MHMVAVVRADPDARDAEGLTPLMRAAWEGRPLVVTRLIRAGAAVDAATPIGETALMKAAFRGHTDVIEASWLPGPMPSSATRMENALLRAAANGQTAVVNCSWRRRPGR